MKSGFHTEHAINLRAFHEKCGRTAGCSACIGTSGGRHDSAAYKWRQFALCDGKLGADSAAHDTAPGSAGASSEAPAEAPKDSDEIASPDLLEEHGVG